MGYVPLEFIEDVHKFTIVQPFCEYAFQQLVQPYSYVGEIKANTFISAKMDVYSNQAKVKFVAKVTNTEKIGANTVKTVLSVRGN
ncbi:hypothetical protein L596_029399 [Steinernema carpocapsae]|uniref:Uncharacterized protein n=1 Tax=Steinernema carpocapsae TaxID=34508 RepID=A0A4U5LUI8_STECR|nr:hypothetical protein L596_029399 [Steinernema carpocapsae]